MRGLLLLLLICGSGLALAQARLTLTPDHGPVGTRVEARATGLPAGAPLEFLWFSAEAKWVVENALYLGVKASETRTAVLKATADAQGQASFSFVVPEDYGYVHNTALVSGEKELARQGFTVVPQLSITPTSGPLGTPITLKVTGLGYRFYERGRHLYYDQKYTGWLTAISSKGTAIATVRATGEVGPHLLELINGPRRGYLNGEQSPNYIPAIPYRTSATFTLTPGPAVLPPDPLGQAFAREAAKAPQGPGPQLGADFASGTVGSLINFQGQGFPANAPVALSYRSVRGNRVGGGGWEEAEVPLGSFSADPGGQLKLTLPTPDDLEGNRVFTAKSGEVQAQFTYRITPSVASFGPSPVQPGGQLKLNLKGTGWTGTGNIYTLVLDNSYLGYACGFNTRGDITVYLTAPLQPGWHFLDLYPSIYEGKSDAPTATTTNDHFQLPMLHFQDHPGERLPAFHLAFEVR